MQTLQTQRVQKKNFAHPTSYIYSMGKQAWPERSRMYYPSYFLLKNPGCTRRSFFIYNDSSICKGKKMTEDRGQSLSRKPPHYIFISRVQISRPGSRRERILHTLSGCSKKVPVLLWCSEYITNLIDEFRIAAHKSRL